MANLILNGKSVPKVLGNREQRITGTEKSEVGRGKKSCVPQVRPVANLIIRSGKRT
ncbi:MAG: hypothetical protein F6K50_13215 [Moorea sp. SIO3I7]|uniref:hypothetical protein n=1 Tax=unclassified Moorena TaxID=2683338 RepID=UPI0013CAE09E|nr:MULTISPECIES: hypothetical protein [unclassified Moorena]NEN96459.1 hypothetical protein [Moorena sp. SIO3I7]NEO22566.1 hypothetical protein [Moorena sp. SIO4A5]NEO65087.1 hypothetical protein [Moorena sp. SIO4G2]NEQ58643.1 hypothetical protein [Moorena sp. SIO4A1]